MLKHQILQYPAQERQISSTDDVNEENQLLPRIGGTSHGARVNSGYTFNSLAGT